MVDEMIISSSSSSSVSLNCLTATEALRRPDVSVVEWYVVNRRYILGNFGDTAKSEVMCSELREELNDAIALLISEESV